MTDLCNSHMFCCHTSTFYNGIQSTKPRKHIFLMPEADRKRSIELQLDYLNDFEDSYRLRRVTICDDKPLGILIEQVLFKGDKKKILTVITKVKGHNHLHPTGLRPNDIILPP